MPYQLAYVSLTSRPWTRPDLLELLRQARTRNERDGITGVLLFRHGRFLQLLEGGRHEVETLYRSIRSDERHHDVTAIWDADAQRRWFEEWSMGFRDLEEDPILEPGLTDILRGPPAASAFGHEVLIQLWSLLRRTEPRP